MGKAYEEIQGTVERITYVNEENQYVVARLEVNGKRDLTTIVGNLPVTPGETVRLRGEWVRHTKYGDQFRVETYETVTPATLTGIERYLGSGLVKGIGPIFAKRLVESFGLDTLRVIDKEPEKLLTVEGIGPVRLERVTKAWSEQREIREVMLFLQSHGVPATHAVKIYKTYRQKALAILQQNPYRLAYDISGIGFKTADAIAQKLGTAADAPARVQAGVLYVLHTLTGDGHVCFPRPALTPACVKVLEVPEAIVDAAIATLQREGEIVIESDGRDTPVVYLKSLYLAEDGVARRLGEIACTSRLPFPLDVEKAIRWAEEQNRIELAPEQQEAIRQAVSSKVTVITGGPGTGKTTILRSLLQILEKKQQRIVLCAPTGRAAKRLSEATGRPAKTIHRLLEWSPAEARFKRDFAHPLEADLVVVDETSMVDIVLMYNLLKAVPLEATLILVGDVDQLPSVGPGTVLRDIIASGAVATTTLRQIFRQAEQSRIVVNAHRINRGEFPLLPRPGEGGSDCVFIEEDDPERIQRYICELAMGNVRAIPFRPFSLPPVSPSEVQVLTPMHRGPIGAAELNRILQETLTPRGPELTRGGRIFRQGDRVMQVKNDYEREVYNGDIGTIRRVDTEEQEVTVLFDDREVSYDGSDLDELTLAYAATIHKSQGNEYPVVLLPIHTSHYIMLQRNLLYTALTRAKRLAILLGTKKALAIAVKNATPEARYSLLYRRLCPPAASP